MSLLPNPIERAIRNARMDLMLDHPFFGCIALRLKLQENKHVTDTCATDGRSLYYAPEFIESLSHAQLVGLIAHEAMHIACQHTLRRDNRHPEAWNIACDFAINSILQNEGFALPPDGCVRPEFSGWSAERIYREIVIEIDVTPQSLSGSGDGDGEADGDGESESDDSDGDDKPSRGPRKVASQSKPKDGKPESKTGEGSSEPEIKIPPKRVNEKVRKMAGAVLDSPDPATDGPDNQVSVLEAAMMAQKQGKLPASIRRVLGSVVRKPIDWRTVLQEFIVARVTQEYTWKRPNKRYADVYLPTRRSHALAEVVFAVDSSGSIDERTLSQSLDAIQAAVDICRPDTVHVVVCDAEVQSHDTFHAGEPISVNPCGGGGTNFNPVFDLIEREGIQPVGLVFFTDGMGYYPEQPPEYPVLWLLSSEYRVPWGNSLLINNEV